MKVLFYGGCHADVFKRIFDKYAFGDHRFDVLTNYKIIRDQIPFPYDSLGNYDAVVFSPILNKGDWNTSYLEAACRTCGIRTFKFPWLQWAGYWPTATRRYWGEHQEWGMRKLYEMAAENSDFDSFYARLFSSQEFVEATRDWIDFTTQNLRTKEQAGDVDVPISDWVYENYRTQQLFVTPDHAGTPLYKYLTRHISDALGLRLDPAFYYLSTHLQNDVLLPILPGVAEALRLDFWAIEWAHSSFLGRQIYGLREFAMSHHGDGVVLGYCTQDTALKKSTGRAGQDALWIKQGARLLFQPLGQDVPSHSRLATISGIGHENRSDERFIYTDHWRLVRPSITPMSGPAAHKEQSPSVLEKGQKSTSSTSRKRKPSLLRKLIRRLS